MIGHLCKWCLVAHGCGLCVAGILLWYRPAIPNTLRLSTLSVAGVGVLVGGQLAYAPPTFEIIEEPPVGQSGATFAPAIDDDGNFQPPGMETDDGEFAPPMDDGEFEAPPMEDEGEFAPPPIDEE